MGAVSVVAAGPLHCRTRPAEICRRSRLMLTLRLSPQSKKPAAVTIRDRFNCVSTTLSITREKDQDSALIFPFAAHFKPH